MVGFTNNKIDRKKLETKIYINVGLPTVKNFNNMVSTSMISKCPISVADIRNSENIHGPLILSLKGKSTRRKPRLLIKDDIHIPSKIYKNNSKI